MRFRTTARLPLFVLAAAGSIIVACGDGDSRRPIGASCESDAGCDSGLCLFQTCVDPALDSNPCGDGIVDAAEACDAGAANGSSTCGCQADCQFAPASVVCREAAECDVAELCDGAGACPADVVAGDETGCTRCTSGSCVCDAGACVDACGNGAVDEGEGCDDGPLNGDSTCGCQADCQFADESVVCRDAGVCDAAELCDGAGACPADVQAVDDSECASCTAAPCLCDAGACIDACGNGALDEALGEACDDGTDNGTSTCGCQADCQFALASVVCREAGACDVAELCDGAGACPVDVHAEDGGSCTNCLAPPCACASGACVSVDTCGDGNVDLGEGCDDGAANGSSTCGCQTSCQFADTTVVCRDAGVCDAAELCDGAGACPEDALAGDGSSCTGCAFAPCQCDTGACVSVDTCGDGTVDEGEGCDDGPLNGDSTCGCQTSCQFADTTVVCRDAGVCDAAELCDGAGACPADALADDGSSCADCTLAPCQCDSGACVTTSLVGTWVATANENDLLVFVFLDDGTYLHAEVDFSDTSEISGMERGEYTLDESNGRLTVDQQGYTDNNGDTGLTDFVAGSAPPLGYFHVIGDTLTLTVDENGDGAIDGTAVFARAASSGVVGTWLATASVHEFLLFIFFDDGTYLHAEDNSQEAPPVHGMEWGTFSRDAVDGQTTAAQSFDNNGGAGLTDFSSVSVAPFLFINVSGDALTFTIDEDGDTTIDATLGFQRQ